MRVTVGEIIFRCRTARFVFFFLRLLFKWFRFLRVFVMCTRFAGVFGIKITDKSRYITFLKIRNKIIWAIHTGLIILMDLLILIENLEKLSCFFFNCAQYMWYGVLQIFLPLKNCLNPWKCENINEKFGGEFVWKYMSKLYHFISYDYHSLTQF